MGMSMVNSVRGTVPLTLLIKIFANGLEFQRQLPLDILVHGLTFARKPGYILDISELKMGSGKTISSAGPPFLVDIVFLRAVEFNSLGAA